jgi:hypothetical protein
MSVAAEKRQNELVTDRTLIQRLRDLRDGIVWRIEKVGFSGMEPSHRPGHRVYRAGPRDDVRNDKRPDVERRPGRSG